jgi:hypothetical protein
VLVLSLERVGGLLGGAELLGRAVEQSAVILGKTWVYEV